MASVPAHIKTARKQGALAGLTQLRTTLDRNTNGGTNGLEQAQEMLAQIEEVGNFSEKSGTFRAPKRAVAWYCNHFADKLPSDLPAVIESRPTRTTRKKSTKSGGDSAIAAADTTQIVAALQALGIEIPGMNEVEDEDDEDDGAEVVQGTRVRRVKRNTTAQVEQEETPAFPPPRDPDAPATSGKLWKLNAEGPDNGVYVVVTDEDGNILAGGDSPITAGEAYDLIGEHLA